MRWGVLGWALACALTVGACVQSSSVACSDGRVCPAVTVCDEAHRGCAQREQFDVCAGKAELSACSYRNVDDGVCAEGVCLPAGCGNAAIDGDEVCDDGNRLHGDGCSADCMSAEFCGNAVIDAVRGEACDDGNTIDGDNCQANCLSPSCGDGVVDSKYNEACDDGAANTDTPNAACRPNCQRKRCGDGVLDAGEVCDDGKPASGDGCSYDCKSIETCGNGYLDGSTGEQCDDNNTISGDGCQANCHLPRCGDEVVDEDRGEACDEGTANSQAKNATCRTNCLPGRCGDDVVDDDEVCDDGNVTPGDNCSFDCQSDETCGNTKIDVFVGESCDDGDYQNHDGCHSTCVVEQCGWRPQLDFPPTRIEHAMASDLGRGKVLVSGGRTIGAQSTDKADAWEWNGSAWSQVANMPNIRRWHAMAYDAARQQVVVFGGYSSTFQNTTWLWDGTSWSTPTPATPPSARYSAAIAYDAARGKVLLFGGQSLSGALADTHQWDGTEWSPLAPSNAPPAGAHSMAYDAARQKIVLYGMRSGAGWESMTWEWDGTNWSDKTPAAPPEPRFAPGVAYDPLRRRVILYGGTSPNGIAMNDTWEWNGTDWLPVTLTSAVPTGRNNIAVGYDPIGSGVLLYGGHRGGFSVGEPYLLRCDSAAPLDNCGAAQDTDADGLVGCADLDCAAYCDPFCVTLGVCTGTRPRCGDLVCSSLETCALCPGDCGGC